MSTCCSRCSYASSLAFHLQLTQGYVESERKAKAEIKENILESRQELSELHAKAELLRQSNTKLQSQLDHVEGTALACRMSLIYPCVLSVNMFHRELIVRWLEPIGCIVHLSIEDTPHQPYMIV